MKDQSAALRHLVYSDLLSLLPIASSEQTKRFVKNLHFGGNELGTGDEFVIEQHTAYFRFDLRVTPESAEAYEHNAGNQQGEIELALASKYGRRLIEVAGFYFDKRLRVNLPMRCSLYGYTSLNGFYNGILCQPLDQAETYFLLSSAKFGGPRAIRMEQKDRRFFEQFRKSSINNVNAAKLQQKIAEPTLFAI